LPAEQAESSARIGLDFLSATRPAASDFLVKNPVTPQARTTPPERRQRICGLHVVAILLVWATRNAG
jgi:hypothetical protein